MEEQKIKVGDPVTQEIVDLIAGLEYMNDGEGCCFRLERIETLSRAIDEEAELDMDNFSNGSNPETIISLCYWQRSLIDEIRSVLNSQDRIVRALRCLIEMPERGEFKADNQKLESIRGLGELFSPGGGLFHDDKADMAKLTAWAKAHHYNLDAVKSLLAPETDSCLSASG